MKTLPLGLAYFLGQYTIYWNLLMVGATIAPVPVLVVVFFAQRYFIKGITLNGVEGVGHAVERTKVVFHKIAFPVPPHVFTPAPCVVTFLNGLEERIR